MDHAGAGFCLGVQEAIHLPVESGGDDPHQLPGKPVNLAHPFGGNIGVGGVDTDSDVPVLSLIHIS